MIYVNLDTAYAYLSNYDIEYGSIILLCRTLNIW